MCALEIIFFSRVFPLSFSPVDDVMVGIVFREMEEKVVRSGEHCYVVAGESECAPDHDGESSAAA